ncbi:hypothetical protein EVAR_60153_1 [Eumeta japonica]|uniref:Uncharacterized protein n=1 Tax=Eumeta variegata TaxID=151549 RepID=A0A4C2A4V8_EUMVA|nr:hypothetical protein EVAR_60153_1 [Eumeta japonica]
MIAVTGRVPVGLAVVTLPVVLSLASAAGDQTKSRGFESVQYSAQPTETEVEATRSSLTSSTGISFRTPLGLPGICPLKGVAPSAQLGPPTLSRTNIGGGFATRCGVGSGDAARHLKVVFAAACLDSAIAYRPCGLQQLGRSPPANWRGINRTSRFAGRCCRNISLLGFLGRS